MRVRIGRLGRTPHGTLTPGGCLWPPSLLLEQQPEQIARREFVRKQIKFARELGLRLADRGRLPLAKVRKGQQIASKARLGIEPKRLQQFLLRLRLITGVDVSSPHQQVEG